MPTLKRAVLVALLCITTAASGDAYRLVFGSFQDAANAEGWARAAGERLPELDLGIERIEKDGQAWYRVVSAPLEPAALTSAMQRVKRLGFDFWRSRVDAPVTPQEPALVAPVEPTLSRDRSGGTPSLPRDRPAETSVDFVAGMQSRFFTREGAAGQSSFHPSWSAQLDFTHTWNDQRDAVSFSPFLRLDAEDAERTHADIRELFYSHVGERYEMHVGIKRVFWGVTEFHHLVDIINQTDLTENVDGEDKLGQPMMNLSMVREWGIVDVFVLPGFRERTFAGSDGRLGPGLPVEARATYDSGARNKRTDAALRWSHHVGPFEFGVHHFSGTSREPMLVPELDADDRWRLRAHYPTIDQTGIDAQALFGDWAFKLEAMSRSGFGARFEAAALGVERTLVGILGTRSDLGIVTEYLYDSRGDAATTIFDHDLAVGARLRMNDMFDSQALMGLVWDHETGETLVSVEASRRLGDEWLLTLEGRAFGGAKPLPNAPAPLVLQSLLDRDAKTASLQGDDVLQLELTRYF